MPKKHKKEPVNDVLAIQRDLFKAVPGMAAMDRLFTGLRGVLFCVKDRLGRYVCANDAFLRRVHIDDASLLVGRTSKEIFPALLAAGYEQQDVALLRDGHEMRERLEMITNPDGSLGWYLTDKVPVRDGGGEIAAIACMSQDLKSPAADDARIGELAKALRRMRHEYFQPLRIAELAEDSGMSLSKFERLMRKILRVSPRQLLTRLRVEAAAERLRETDDGLGEIAIDCGFYDQPSFCRQFKATTGLTALRYRKLSREV